MTLGQGLAGLANLVWVLLFAVLTWRAVRERTRIAVDSALVFGVLGVAVLQGLVLRALGIPTDSLPLLVTEVLLVMVLAIPFLTVRLVDDFAGVPAALMRATFVTFVLLAVGLVYFVLNPTMAVPGVLGLLLILYFAVAEIYATVAFWLGARRAAGSTKFRMRAAFAGGLLIGITALSGSVRSFAPAFAEILTPLLTLAAASSYLVAFAPPSYLRRAWREPPLRRFVESVTAAATMESTDEVRSELAGGIAAVMGAQRARIFLVDEPSALTEEMSAIAARAIGEATLVSTSEGATLIAAPIMTRHGVVGAAAVVLEHSPIFIEERTDMLRLLADQSATALEGARMRDEIRRTSQAKSEFLANMSHELRTPLNAILGFAALLAERQGLSDRDQRYLKNINDAGEHLLTVINDVLDLSRVEAGRIELHPDRIALRTLLEPVISSAAATADARGIRFEHEALETLVVRLDAGRLRQALFNLVSNAMKFTPSGGVVRLRVTVNGDDLCAEVSDTGIGIPVERQDRVFGVFERLNEDRSAEGGTGLGLALTRRLIELHGGTIGFESEVGKGTAFRIVLPGVVAEQIAGARILVVEDDTRDAELITAIAANRNLRTEVVTTVAGALDALERELPVGVVLDLRLPDGRGEQLLQVIRSDARYRGLSVAVVTVEEESALARDLGVAIQVVKPVRGNGLDHWLDGLKP